MLSKQNKLQKGLHPKIMSKMFNLQVISLKSKNNVKMLKFSAIIFLTKNIATINFEAMQDDSSSSIALPNKIMLQLKVSAVTFQIQKCLYQKVWLRGRMLVTWNQCDGLKIKINALYIQQLEFSHKQCCF